MSEQISHHSPEKHAESLEVQPPIEVKKPEHAQEVRHEEISSHELEQIKAKVEQQSISGKEIAVGEEQETSGRPLGVFRELKSTAYKHTLKRIQSRLNTPERVFSRVIHRPVVERLSNFGAKTVARPSGILGGGVAALTGSSVVLYLARRYGFEYNYFVFFALFIGGFVIGLVLEGVIRLFRKQHE